MDRLRRPPTRPRPAVGEPIADRRSAIRPRARALSLVEMLLTLTLSSLVGLGVAMMLAAAAAGTQSQNDTRQATTRSQVATHRLGNIMRGAAMVLAAEDDHLVLWTGDAEGNDEVNLAEMRRVQWDDETGEIRLHQTPDDPQENPSYELDGTNFSNVTASWADTQHFPGEVIFTHASGWDLQLDDDEVQSAKLIRLHLTLDHDETGPRLVKIIGALRVPLRPPD